MFRGAVIFKEELCENLIHAGCLGRRLYNNTLYMEQLFYFNTLMRPAIFPHTVQV